MKFKALVAALFLAGCQTGETPQPADEQPESPAMSDLATMLEGRTVMFEDGATAAFDRDGSYLYELSGDVERGEYTIEGSTVCVEPDEGEGRCDEYVEEDGNYYRVGEEGERTLVTHIG